jgi:adhesin HecA-like repeat protein
MSSNVLSSPHIITLKSQEQAKSYSITVKTTPFDLRVGDFRFELHRTELQFCVLGADGELLGNSLHDDLFRERAFKKKNTAKLVIKVANDFFNLIVARSGDIELSSVQSFKPLRIVVDNDIYIPESGKLAFKDKVSIKCRDFINEGGEIDSDATISITAEKQIIQAGKVHALGCIKLALEEFGSGIFNNGGSIISEAGLDLSGGCVKNENGGLLKGEESVTFSASSVFFCSDSTVTTLGSLNIKVDAYCSLGGVVYAAGKIDILARKYFSSEDHARLSSQEDITIDASTAEEFINTGNSVIHAGKLLSITTSGLTDNQGNSLLQGEYGVKIKGSGVIRNIASSSLRIGNNSVWTRFEKNDSLSCNMDFLFLLL